MVENLEVIEKHKELNSNYPQSQLPEMIISLSIFLKIALGVSIFTSLVAFTIKSFLYSAFFSFST